MLAIYGTAQDMISWNLVVLWVCMPSHLKSKNYLHSNTNKYVSSLMLMTTQYWNNIQGVVKILINILPAFEGCSFHSLNYK